MTSARWAESVNYESLMTTLTVTNLSKRYGETPVVRSLNIEVASGEMVALLGPSGCGKTTTMRMIAGLLPPDTGDIRFDGRSVLKTPAERRGAVMVFQKHLLFPHLSIVENVAFGLKMRGVAARTRRQQAEAMLEHVRLAGLGSRRPHELSGGQQQRVALARALVVNPDVLLLDEPLSNLDANLRVEMRQLIRSLQQEFGITTIFVTHDQEEAVMLADRIALMMEGELLQFDTPRAFYTRPQTQAVARFFRNENFLEGRKRGAVVETALGSILAPACADLPDGDVLITVRPEHVSLVCDARPNSIAAIVTSVTYMGTYTRVETLVGNRRWVVAAPPDLTPAINARVHLFLPEPNVWLLPA